MRQKKKRPVKKKSSPPAPAPDLISGPDLELLTGLTDRRHRQIADEGFFAKPAMGQYARRETIQGMFRYYRELSDKASLSKKREELIDEKIVAEKTKNAEAAGKLESKEAIAAKLSALGEEIKSTLNFQLTDRLPAINAGLDAAVQRVNNRAVFLEILKRWQEFSQKWIAPPAAPAPEAPA